MTGHRSDEELALEFLAGKFEESEGQVFHKYLEADSKEEGAARDALLRLLRSPQPLSNTLRWRLAALLDPAHTLEERKFLIQNRQAGSQPHNVIALEMARFIAETVATGCKVDAAVAAAAARYAASERTVWRVWSDHKWSPLIRPIWEAGRTVN
jgi:hypothetical protein